jgi:glycosyltransferase involved in cell wall biosynthesis
MPNLRIGVNALYLIPGGVGGTEIYLRNLLDALASIDRRNTYFLFTNRETEAGLKPAAANFVHVPQWVSASNRPARLLWEQTMLPLTCRRLRLDCVFNPGFTAPALPGCPNVTVFHDLQHKRHPEYFRKVDLPAWNFFLWLSVKRTARFLADSEPTRADLVRFYNVAAEKVDVALLGVEHEFFSLAAMRGPVEPYLLCVSTLHPHKNIERLVRVFARLRELRPEYRLVLAGMRGFHTRAVEDLVARLGLERAVEITGWIPRGELYALYRRAAAFVYPSTFEGFGLPVVEAMAAGVPLACSNIEPLRSIVADGAVLFDPYDEDDMLRAIATVLDGKGRVEAGLRRAQAFTWKLCAERTLRTIQAAVSEANPRAGS